MGDFACVSPVPLAAPPKAHMASGRTSPTVVPSGISGKTTFSLGDDRSDKLEFEDVKVQLLTHSDDTSEFIVYTAIVSAHFLRRFAEPTKVSGTEQERGIRIEYQKVPIWPVLGLKERLGKALGRDIAGNYFDEDIVAAVEIMVRTGASITAEHRYTGSYCLQPKPAHSIERYETVRFSSSQLHSRCAFFVAVPRRPCATISIGRIGAFGDSITVAAKCEW